MRYLAKKDAGHPEIVEGLRAVGVSVLELHAHGGPGVPDLLVGYRGVDQMLEVKRPGWKKPSGGSEATTRSRQVAFAAMWQGHKVVTVTSLEEAYAAVGARVALPRRA